LSAPCFAFQSGSGWDGDQRVVEFDVVKAAVNFIHVTNDDVYIVGLTYALTMVTTFKTRRDHPW